METRHMITNKTKSLIEAELHKLYEAHEKFRKEITLAASSGAQMEIDHVREEEFIWENRIRRLKQLINNKKIILPEKQSKTINLGSSVVIQINGREEKFILDGIGYQNKTIRIVSTLSQVGARLLGKKAGDILAKDGTMPEIRILKISQPC